MHVLWFYFKTQFKRKINSKESSQRFYKQRDEQAVDYVADGKVICTEIKYAAETEQMDRDGPAEHPSDWDSLSDRVRKARRQQKTLLQQHRGKQFGINNFFSVITKSLFW